MCAWLLLSASLVLVTAAIPQFIGRFVRHERTQRQMARRGFEAIEREVNDERR